MAEISLDSDLVTLDNINLEPRATAPTAPATGRIRIYGRADGSIVVQTPDGVEHVGGGEAGGSLTIEEVDGVPSLAATKLIVENGTLTNLGGGEVGYVAPMATLNLKVGVDGGAHVDDCSEIVLVGGTLTNPSGGVARYTPPGAAGGATLTIPPAASSWTVYGAAGATLSDDGDAVRLSVPYNASASHRLAAVAVGVTFTLTARLSLLLPSYVNNDAGLMLHDSVGGGWVSFGFGGTYGQIGLRYNVALTGNPTAAWGPYFGPPPSAIWLRIVQDATHRTFYVSPDGTAWYQVHQTAQDHIITPNVIGFGGQSLTSAQPTEVILDSWVLS